MNFNEKIILPIRSGRRHEIYKKYRRKCSRKAPPN